ncbi:MAG: FAD-dependent oxidoreductase [Micrococcus sp.]|nr:FAD-dependent oxidoreductase [Micrococcus sp.]
MRIAVVGAGVIGLVSAVRLRAAGHAVTLIAPELSESLSAATAAEFANAGASHAAAGMLAPLGETQFSQDGLAAALDAAALAYPDLIDLLATFTDAPAGYRAEGAWIVAADPADARTWSPVLDHAALRGRRVEPVSARALRRAEPALAPGLHAGFDAPDDHQVDPRRLLGACLSALVSTAGPDGAPLPAGSGPSAQGVRARVESIEQDGERVVLNAVLPDGAPQRLAADAAVLAAGLGHPQITGAPAAQPVALRPVHGEVLRLRVRPEQLLPGESHLLTRTVRALVHGRQIYIVPRDGGGLVVGASSREDGSAATQAGAVLDLLADAAAVLPAVRECVLEEVLTRARPGSPDDAPRVLALDDAPRVVVANAFHRHGILLAPWAAEQILDRLAVHDHPTPDRQEQHA